MKVRSHHAAERGSASIGRAVFQCLLWIPGCGDQKGGIHDRGRARVRHIKAFWGGGGKSYSAKVLSGTGFKEYLQKESKGVRILKEKGTSTAQYIATPFNLDWERARHERPRSHS